MDIDMTSSDSGDEPFNPNDDLIYPGARLIRGDCNKLLAAFIIRANLADAEVSHFIELCNMIAPQDFLDQNVKKFFDRFNLTKPEKKFICPVITCQTLLEPVEEDDTLFLCSSCEIEHSEDYLVRLCSFFSYLPVRVQLEKYIFNERVLDQIAINRTDKTNNTVLNSRRYKSMEASGILSKNDLTLLLNTDGVKAAKSSGVSLWPVQLTILELPLNVRQKHVMLPIVWLSKKKPILNEILRPLIEELKKLSTEGIDTPFGTFRLHVVICPVDSQARCMIMNYHQYNGSYPCPWCLTPGESREQGKGTARFFVGDLDADRRTTENVLMHMQEAVTNGVPVYGVKGPSIMGELPTFDIVWGYNPEYLHNTCLGLFVTLLTVMTAKENKKKAFYIKKHMRTLDKRLLDVTPTSEMTRLPEKFSDFKHMKASLLKNFLCYFFLPIVQDILPKHILNHLLLFVYGVRLYLNEELSDAEEHIAADCIRKFCEKAPEIYGYKICTFNFHIFSHVPEVCREWGGLYDSSTFPFEGHNGFILKLSHGTKYQTEQILRNHQLYQTVVNANFSSEEANDLAKDLLSSTRRLKICKKFANCTFFGHPKVVQLSQEATDELALFAGQPIQGTGVSVYLRFTFNNTLIHCYDYERLRKRKNCVFLNTKEEYICIKDLLLYKTQQGEENVCIRYYNMTTVKTNFAEDKSMKISSGDLWCTSTIQPRYQYGILEDLHRKNVCFGVETNTFISLLTNRFERD